MSMQLTTTNNRHLIRQQMDAEPLGLEEFDSSYFAPPRWSVVQPTSKWEGADAHVGQFRRNLDGEYRQSLDVVVIKAQPNNAMFGSPDAKVPECFSTDGVNGSVYGSCAICRFNRWYDRELDQALRNGANEKHCGVGGQNLIVVTRDDNALALIGVTGTSIKPIKAWEAKQRLLRKPLWAQPVTLTTTRVVNEKGKFYVLQAASGADFTAAERAEWRKLFDLVASVQVATVEADPEVTVEVPDESAF